MTVTATSQGIKPGICTSTSRPANPYLGMVIFETDTSKMKVWLGSAWSNGYQHVSTLSVDYLVVAGGGGGGADIGGGGGAGGLRSTVTATGGGGSLESPLTLGAGTYTVTIGGGGASNTTTSSNGTNGSNSVFSTITSTGGGGGGSRSAPARSTGRQTVSTRITSGCLACDNSTKHWIHWKRKLRR